MKIFNTIFQYITDVFVMYYFGSAIFDHIRDALDNYKRNNRRIDINNSIGDKDYINFAKGNFYICSNEVSINILINDMIASRLIQPGYLFISKSSKRIYRFRNSTINCKYRLTELDGYNNLFWQEFIEKKLKELNTYDNI